MSNKTRFLVIILLLPSLAEAVNGEYLIPISGFPLSVGRMTFILSGLIGLSIFGFRSYKTNIFKGLTLVALGSFIGAFFSDDLLDNLSASLGFLTLLIGSSGVAMLLNHGRIRSVIDIYFIVLFFYWSLYVLSLTFSGGSFRSYSLIDKEENLINHHIIGMSLSISSTYLAVRFYFKNGRLHGLGYVLLGTTLISELLIESRSNFIFLLITVAILFLTEHSGMKRFLIKIIPTILFGILIFMYFTSHIEPLKRRFTLIDVEYQERTTEMRINYLRIAFNVIKNDPFGKGLENVKLNISGDRRLAHNQYVTFTLAGGIIAFIGVILWLKDIFNTFIKIYKKKIIYWDYGENSFLYGSIITSLVFNITLLSIEFTGLVFFLIVSMSIFALDKLRSYDY